MNERQKLVEKAKKIAVLMMRSPFQGERVAAAALLHKFMNEHGLSTKDVGLEYIDPKYEFNNTNNEVDDPDVVELNYKTSYPSIRGGWVENLIVRVCLVYGVRFGVQGDTIKIIGYRSEVNAVKAIIINLREHIQGRISVHHFANERQILAYASCFIHKITKGLYHPKDTAKLSRLSCYMYKHYSLLPVESNYDGYIRYDFRTFVLAQVDARDYKYRNAA
jgi:hypothetical protein